MSFTRDSSNQSKTTVETLPLSVLSNHSDQTDDLLPSTTQYSKVVKEDLSSYRTFNMAGFFIINYSKLTLSPHVLDFVRRYSKLENYQKRSSVGKYFNRLIAAFASIDRQNLQGDDRLILDILNVLILDLALVTFYFERADTATAVNAALYRKRGENIQAVDIKFRALEQKYGISKLDKIFDRVSFRDRIRGNYRTNNKSIKMHGGDDDEFQQILIIGRGKTHKRKQPSSTIPETITPVITQTTLSNDSDESAPNSAISTPDLFDNTLDDEGCGFDNNGVSSFGLYGSDLGTTLLSELFQGEEAPGTIIPSYLLTDNHSSFFAAPLVTDSLLNRSLLQQRLKQDSADDLLASIEACQKELDSYKYFLLQKKAASTSTIANSLSGNQSGLFAPSFQRTSLPLSGEAKNNKTR